MYTPILFVAILATVQAASLQEFAVNEWATFKVNHGKTYESNAEESLRMRIYLKNKEKIAEHNALYEAKKVSYQLKMNAYGDMLEHEFGNMMNGFNQTAALEWKSKNPIMVTSFTNLENVQWPDSMDWRARGAVSAVKDQKQCGSCWAFATNGALEGQHFRRTGVMEILSEQNLVDCSGKYGNNGCSGGWMTSAYRYIKDNGGIDTQLSYPYEARNGPCRYNSRAVGATENGYAELPSGNEGQLQAGIANIGPIAVSVDASKWQFYANGVFYNSACDAGNVNHGVTAVGYGRDPVGGDYWILKNSWGINWGENGYIRMARNRNNHCGVASHPSYPTV